MKLDYSIVETQYAGHAIKLAAAAADEGGMVRIYACGGDGTLNETACGIIGKPNAAITHYPRGTGNDFIKSVGAPDNFLNLPALVTGETIDIDCIDAGGGRYAINICSVGVDADVTADMPGFRWSVKLGGKVPYNLSLLLNVIKGIYRHYNIVVDGEVIEGDFTILTACNGQVYGGGFRACPDADPTDGKLEILLVKRVSRFTLARIVGGYAAGEYKKYPQYIRRITGRELTIKSERPVNVNFDGETFKSDNVTFKLSPHKIKFILPNPHPVSFENGVQTAGLSRA